MSNYDVWEAAKRARELEAIIHAYHLLGSEDVLPLAEAERELEEIRTVQRWLDAEQDYRFRVMEWLAAENRHRLYEQLVRNDETYRAAEAGWNLMKQAAPRLDGVDTFSQLPRSLQDRYAVFAKGVLQSKETEQS